MAQFAGNRCKSLRFLHLWPSRTVSDSGETLRKLLHSARHVGQPIPAGAPFPEQRKHPMFTCRIATAVLPPDLK